MRRTALACPLLLLLAAAVPADTREEAITGCWRKEDAALLLTAPDRDDMKSAGKCIVVPPGTDFIVERRSATAACIRPSGFDACLWTAELSAGE